MHPFQRLSLSLFFAINAIASHAFAVQTFHEESEQDLPLRRQNPLYLRHSIGSVRVQGWVQDRVRVTLKKQVLAETKEEAEKAFKKLELVSLETPSSFEIRVGKDRGADIVTKLKESQHEPVTVDLEIRAPYQSDFTIILGEGRDLDLQQWRGGLTVNGKNSSIKLAKLTLAKPLKVNCQSCEVEINDSKLSGHVFSGGKSVAMNGVDSVKDFSIDAGVGEVRLERTTGKIEVHTTTGRMSSGNHQGTLSFQSKEGGLFVTGIKGNLEAQTQTGQLMAEAESVQSYLQLDNQKGDVQISLPPKFEGNLDLLSLRGETVVQFPTQLNPKLASESYGPSSPGRVDGYIGKKNNINIHAYTRDGGVRILRKVPKL